MNFSKVALTFVSSFGCAIAGFSQEPAVMPTVIRGAPFTAEAVTESTQVLADGNRIVRTTSAFISRDSEGRTRREQRIPAGNVVFLQDPISDQNYVLETSSRVARRIRAPKAATTATSPNLPQPGQRALTSSPLGVEVIEGGLAEGTRVIRTITAGQAGNERQVDVIVEIWYSSELSTPIMTRTTVSVRPTQCSGPRR